MQPSDFTNTSQTFPVIGADVPVELLGITKDRLLADELAHIAAAAGMELTIVTSLAKAQRVWSQAVAIVVERGLEVCPVARRSQVTVAVSENDDCSELDLWRYAALVGAERISVIPKDAGELAEYLAQTAESPSVRGKVVGVVGATGGVGATAVALALTQAFSEVKECVLVESHPGGRAELSVSAEEVRGLRWPDVRDASGHLGADAIHDALPRPEQLAGGALLSWGQAFHDHRGLTDEAVATVLDTLSRGFDTVVWDMPTTFAHHLPRCDVVFIVADNQLHSVASARRLRSFLVHQRIPYRMLIRRTSKTGVDTDMLPQAVKTQSIDFVPEDKALRVAGEEGRLGASLAKKRWRVFSNRLVVGLGGVSG